MPRWKSNERPDQITVANVVDTLNAEIRDLKEERDDLQQRLNDAEEKFQQLRAEAPYD